MSDTRKPFSLELYQENDEKARNAVMQYLNDEDLYVKPNDDRYGPDLCVYLGYKHKAYIEVEVKRVWKADQDTFPWSTVQIPERKRKFTKTTKSVEFWILRSDLKMAVIIPDYILDSSDSVEVPNSMVSSGEKFIQVPIEQCIIRSLTNTEPGDGT